jgi:hypothetical protein
MSYLIFCWNPVISLPFAIRAGHHMAQGNLRAVDAMFIAVAAFTSLSGLMVLLNWTGSPPSRRDRWLEDELTRALRGRALQLGFLVMYASVLVVLAIAVWRPAWALTVLPALPMTGVSAGLLRFVQLDRRAERGDV